MKKLKRKGKKSPVQGMIFPGAVFLVLVILMINGTLYFDHMSNRQNLDLTRQSIKRAAIQCYTIEGSYPADVAYLEKNYGIVVDHDKFFIDYMSIASNIMPNIEVYEKY